jgi:hypothetical protein
MAIDHREAADGHAARARELLVEAGDVPEQTIHRATVEAVLAVFHQLKALEPLGIADVVAPRSAGSAMGARAGAGDHVSG